MKQNALRWLLPLTLCASGSAQAVVILQYHHVSDSTPKSTSVTPAQFTEQMHYLRDQQFQVLPLEQALTAIKAKQPLPPKSVVITFDDGYNDVAEHAHPLLKQLGYPYTVFVELNAVEHGYGDAMNWQTLQQLASEGATIANHTADHSHLIRKTDGETSEQWRARIKANIEQTEAAIVANIGHNLKALAYPYGEFNGELQQLLTEMGYSGIGQHSGAAGPYSDFTAIPRFPVAAAYADMSSLKLKLNSRNMPVAALQGAESQLTETNPPLLTVTLDGNDLRREQLMCYIQGQGAKAPTWIDADTFTIQADKPMPVGRSRYNCTAPSRSSNNYYWFSQPWVKLKG